MKRLLVVLLALGALAGGVWARRRGLLTLPVPGGAAAPRAPVPEESVEARVGDVRVSFIEAGELAPKTRVLVKSDVSGHVVELRVADGQAVRKGEVLAVVQAGRGKAERYVPWEIRSPMDGTVVDLRAAKGDVVLSGLSESGAGTVLMTVADLKRMTAALEIHELDAAGLRPAMDARVLVEALPGEVFPGRVAALSPVAFTNDLRLKVFKTEVDILAEDPRLKPGLSCRVEVLLSERKGVLKVPLEAVHERGGEIFVYLVRAAAVIQAPVRLGLRSESEAEVLEGLVAGDRLSVAR